MKHMLDHSIITRTLSISSFSRRNICEWQWCNFCLFWSTVWFSCKNQPVLEGYDKWSQDRQNTPF